jgi:hypothetical protein
MDECSSEPPTGPSGGFLERFCLDRFHHPAQEMNIHLWTEFSATCADEPSPAGVLHGQRVSSTTTSETAWPLPSSGDPNRPVTSHATGKAGEGQWQAFAGERVQAAAAAAAARRAAERRGGIDHKSRSEATGVAGEDNNNDTNASVGGQSGSTSAGPSGQTAAASAAPQPARQVVSSSSKAAGGEKTGGWSTVRESMSRARAAFSKEEPPSPSQEAEKRRKLRAGDIQPPSLLQTLHVTLPEPAACKPVSPIFCLDSFETQPGFSFSYTDWFVS